MSELGNKIWKSKHNHIRCGSCGYEFYTLGEERPWSPPTLEEGDTCPECEDGILWAVEE